MSLSKPQHTQWQFCLTITLMDLLKQLKSSNSFHCIVAIIPVSRHAKILIDVTLICDVRTKVWKIHDFSQMCGNIWKTV